MPGDQWDVSLEDDELLTEAELTTNVIVGAIAAAGPLTRTEVDRILGFDARAP